MPSGWVSRRIDGGRRDDESAPFSSPGMFVFASVVEGASAEQQLPRQLQLPTLLKHPPLTHSNNTSKPLVSPPHLSLAFPTFPSSLRQSISSLSPPCSSPVQTCTSPLIDKTRHPNHLPVLPIRRRRVVVRCRFHHRNRRACPRTLLPS